MQKSQLHWINAQTHSLGFIKPAHSGASAGLELLQTEWREPWLRPPVCVWPWLSLSFLQRPEGASTCYSGRQSTFTGMTAEDAQHKPRAAWVVKCPPPHYLPALWVLGDPFPSYSGCCPLFTDRVLGNEPISAHQGFLLHYNRMLQANIPGSPKNLQHRPRFKLFKGTFLDPSANSFKGHLQPKDNCT